MLWAPTSHKMPCKGSVNDTAMGQNAKGQPSQLFAMKWQYVGKQAYG